MVVLKVIVLVILNIIILVILEADVGADADHPRLRIIVSGCPWILRIQIDSQVMVHPQVFAGGIQPQALNAKAAN